MEHGAKLNLFPRSLRSKWEIMAINSCHVVVSEDMMEFLAIEVGLELAYLLAVGVHLLLSAVPILVDLLDDDFGVAVRE